MRVRTNLDLGYYDKIGHNSDGVSKKEENIKKIFTFENQLNHNTPFHPRVVMIMISTYFSHDGDTKFSEILKMSLSLDGTIYEPISNFRRRTRIKVTTKNL